MATTNNPKNAVTKAPKTEAQKALETIDEYLQEHEGWTKGIAWHLHCFCRRGKGDDFGFESFTLEHTAWFLDMLIKTFMNPKASKLFCTINDSDPETLSENLMALRNLFNNFTEDDTVMARIERIEAGHFGHPVFDRTDEDFHNMRLRYERAKDLAFTENKIIDYYKGQFKNK